MAMTNDVLPIFPTFIVTLQGISYSLIKYLMAVIENRRDSIRNQSDATEVARSYRVVPQNRHIACPFRREIEELRN
jgi:hypothetical protein